MSEEQAATFFKQSLKSQDKERYLRPDLYLKKKKKEIDDLVREEIIPQLLVDYELTLQGTELTEGKFLLPAKYRFLYKNSKNNGALLGQYFNLSLKHHIGDSRDGWKLDDYDRAIAHVSELDSHAREIMGKHLQEV